MNHTPFGGNNHPPLPPIEDLSNSSTVKQNSLLQLVSSPVQSVTSSQNRLADTLQHYTGVDLSYLSQTKTPSLQDTINQSQATLSPIANNNINRIPGSSHSLGTTIHPVSHTQNISTEADSSIATTTTTTTTTTTLPLQQGLFDSQTTLEDEEMNVDTASTTTAPTLLDREDITSSSQKVIDSLTNLEDVQTDEEEDHENDNLQKALNNADQEEDKDDDDDDDDVQTDEEEEEGEGIGADDGLADVEESSGREKRDTLSHKHSPLVHRTDSSSSSSPSLLSTKQQYDTTNSKQQDSSSPLKDESEEIREEESTTDNELSNTSESGKAQRSGSRGTTKLK